MFVPKTFVPDSAPQQGTFTPKSFVPEKKTIGGFIGNVGKSAVNTVEGIGSALINTVNPDMEKNTVYNLGKLGVGAAELLIPGEQGAEQTARNVGNFYKQRYGGLSNIGNTLYNDPVGAALDASAVLGGVGGLAKGAAGLATRGATDVSLASNAARLGKFGSGLTRASEIIDPITFASKGIAKTGKYLAGDAPEVLRTASNDVLTKGYGQPGKLEDISGVAGRPVGKLIHDYKVYDRNPETIGNAISSASEKYDSLLKNSGKPISTKDLLTSLDSQIKKLDNESLLSETAASQRDALISRRSSIEKFLSENNAVPLNFSPETAVKMKRNIYKDVKPATFNPSYAGSGSQMAAKDAYRQLISSIDDSAPGTRQLGRDQAALMQLQDVAETALSRGKAKQGFGVGDSARVMAGGSAYGVPGAIATYAVGKIANSPLGTELRSKAYGKLADIAEAGSPGVERAGNILSKSYSAGKNASRISSFLLSPRPQEDPTKLLSQPRQQSQKISPYLPTSITPPVNNTYNFKQKVIKRPKNVFSKEQGGGNPFGGITKTVQDWQAQNRSNVSKIDVPDVPQSFVQGAITGAAGFTGLDKKIPIGREYTPKTNAGKVASVIGSGVGYAAGAGRYIAPAEKYIQGALNVPKVAASAPLVTKAANVFAQKVVPPVATQMISSLPGAITNTVINKEKFLPTYAKSVAGGLAGRAIGAGVGAVADKVAPFFSKSNVFKAEQPKGMPGVIQKGLELERNFVSSTANGDIQPRNIGKYAEKLKLQTAAGGDPTTLFNKEIPLLLVQIPGKIGALKMSPSQIISNSNFIKYVTGPANESAKALFR